MLIIIREDERYFFLYVNVGEFIYLATYLCIYLLTFLLT